MELLLSLPLCVVALLPCLMLGYLALWGWALVEVVGGGGDDRLLWVILLLLGGPVGLVLYWIFGRD